MENGDRRRKLKAIAFSPESEGDSETSVNRLPHSPFFKRGLGGFPLLNRLRSISKPDSLKSYIL